MTEKLYYLNAYTSEFDATVLSSLACEGGFVTILDKTAFFPEEGGQAADTGLIGGIRVLDVKERDGIIYHYTESQLTPGAVHAVIDFDKRFEKMQCHTAEHILCGIIHKLFGYENVGFHLGDDLVTFDVDGELSREEIERVEALANAAVFENRVIRAYFPKRQELSLLEYRSKLDLVDNVRIVEIDGVDMCACCAPHVAMTGEIGVIKIVDFMRHRGGMRLFMQAGYRAYRDYAARQDITRAVGALTSTPSLETLDAVKQLISERDELSRSLKLARLEMARVRAESVKGTDGNLVYLFPDAGMDEMRELANLAVCRVGGMLVVLSPKADGYTYLIASQSVDLRSRVKEINAQLSGRGGGKPEMVSGSFSASLLEIEEYFK